MTTCCSGIQFTARHRLGSKVAVSGQYWSALRETLQPATLVLAVAEADLGALLMESPGPLEDRGTKNRARPLGAYFRGRSGLMLLRAGYSNAGQALRGLRALAVSIAESAVGAICLVALGSEVFEAVCRRVSPAAQDSDQSSPELWSTSSTQLLLECFNGETVPGPLSDTLVGGSAAIDLVRRQIVRAAQHEQNVLIQGETGTGKEIVAAQIHQLSRRKDKPLVIVNCASLPDHLFESELFGHAKGAFTGATAEKPGLWSRANGGTLFLDEVGELAVHHQTKLLRALECGRFTPLGRLGEEESDARVVAATNRNLNAMVKAGQFREDLYFRLFMLSIRTPPLRARLDDVPLIADRLWETITKGSAPKLSSGVKELLRRHHWPGNVRELKSFLTYLHFLFGTRDAHSKHVEAVMEERLGPRKSPRQDA